MLMSQYRFTLHGYLQKTSGAEVAPRLNKRKTIYNLIFQLLLRLQRYTLSVQPTCSGT